MLPVRYRVRRVARETADVRSLTLEPLDEPLAPPAPGQFNMVYAFGVGEVALSISGGARNDGTTIHTVRDVGFVSRAIAGAGIGDVVGLRGPFGHGWPVAEADRKDVMIVAGGIGLAPLRPAVLHLLAERERYGRIAVLYGGRTPRDLLYRQELSRWRSRLDVEVEITVDSAGSDWRGDVGVVTRLISRAAFDPANALAMICGPEVMMRYCVAELIGRGVASASIYLAMERNMKCAVGFCGHCQFGPEFICKDGPVFQYSRVAPLWKVREL
jgi:NAD(P)H-flavin reductase